MSDKPNLGLATTKQLIEELAARAEVSASNREEWVDYKTLPDPTPWPKLSPQLLELGYRWDRETGHSFVVVDNGNGHEWAEVGR